MNLLLISNSTNPGEGYLEYPKENIKEFCMKYSVNEVTFIPYAAVTFSYDEYEKKVQKRFSEFDVRVISIHHSENPVEAILNSTCIVVGGGNTFMLVKKMQENDLMIPIQKKVMDGTPYIGWSAGSNVTCPTLCTTNDMPIVEPQSFRTLNLIPFQINPHYTDAKLEGHGGETREQRIMEYIAANQQMYVAGLREGCMLLIEDESIKLIGKRKLRIFRYNTPAMELETDSDLSFLMR